MRVATKICAFTLAAAVAAPGYAQELLLGLTDSNSIVSFNSATPGTFRSSSAITGLGAGEVLTGIDVRPADGNVYSLSTAGNLYRLDDVGATYAAALIGNITTASVIGSNFGIDFNPVPDRLRFVTDGDQNLRINPGTGVAIVDGTINPADLNIVAVSYTNSRAGATSTTLYGIDTLTSSLLRSTNPNAGSYVTVGSLGLPPIGPAERVNLDISGRTGFAYLSRSGDLFTVDLGSGAATLVGAGPSGVSLVGLTVLAGAPVPEPATWAMMILGFGLAGAAMRRRRLATA